MAASSKKKGSTKGKKDPNKDYVVDLIEVAEHVLSLTEQRSGKGLAERSKRPDRRVSQEQLLRKHITRYKDVVRLGSFGDHSEYFLEIYDKFHDDFLNLVEKDESGDKILNDDFLLDNVLQIWWGFRNDKIKRKGCILPISSIYQRAANLEAEITKKLTNNLEKDTKLMSDIAYYIGAEFLYYLVTIIRNALGKKHEDFKILTSHLKFLEEEAHLSRDPNQSLIEGIDRIKGGVVRAVNRADIMPDGNPIDEETLPESKAMIGYVHKAFRKPRTIKSMTSAAKKINKNMGKGKKMNGEKAFSSLFKTMIPALREVNESLAPPEGVNLTPEAKKKNDEFKKKSEKLIDDLPNVLRKIDIGGIMEDAKEQASDTDPDSSESSDNSSSSSSSSSSSESEDDLAESSSEAELLED